MRRTWKNWRSVIRVCLCYQCLLGPVREGFFLGREDRIRQGMVQMAGATDCPKSTVA